MFLVRRLSWISIAQRTASTALGNSASTASPAVLKMRPPPLAMKSSVTRRYDARRRSVSSSSSATSRLKPAISAAKIAAILRFMKSSLGQTPAAEQCRQKFPGATMRFGSDLPSQPDRRIETGLREGDASHKNSAPVTGDERWYDAPERRPGA